MASEVFRIQKAVFYDSTVSGHGNHDTCDYHDVYRRLLGEADPGYLLWLAVGGVFCIERVLDIVDKINLNCYNIIC